MTDLSKDAAKRAASGDSTALSTTYAALISELRATVDQAAQHGTAPTSSGASDIAEPTGNWGDAYGKTPGLRNAKRGNFGIVAVLLVLAAAGVTLAVFSGSGNRAEPKLAAEAKQADATLITMAASARETAEAQSAPARTGIRNVSVLPFAPEAVDAFQLAPGETSPPRQADNASADPAVVVAQLAPAAAGTLVNGISDKEIRFGMAAPFSGSARELGRQMKLGIESAFNLANEAGGVHGRALKLFSADDGYEPTRTADAMKELTDKAQVFGIIGNVGTPTAAIALPIALERKMVFFGAFTGANLLRRDPPDRYAFNYRASYAEETAAVVRYLVKVRRLQPSEIVVFAQKDAFGDAGYAGVTKAIRALPGNNVDPLRIGYNRNTVEVQGAVGELKARRGQTKAVIMVATYRAAAKFIEKTRDDHPNMIYTNVSFVGSTSLADELMLLGPKYAAGVIVTQVVPEVNSYSSLVLKYKGALNKYFPGELPDYVSLEGFIDASLMIEALNRTGPALNTEKFVETLESIRNFDMGLGTPLNFSIGEHQASHKVWGTQLDKAGRYGSIDLE